MQSAKTYNGCDTDALEEAIDYIYNEYCLDTNASQTRRLSAIGLSLGASVLALYNAKLGDRSRLDSSVGVGCHFDTDEA